MDYSLEGDPENDESVAAKPGKKQKKDIDNGPCVHIFNDGMVCTSFNSRNRHANAFHHPPAAGCTEHATPNGLPCEHLHGDGIKAHNPQALVDRTYGTEPDIDDMDRYERNSLPMMCPGCPIDPKGIDWNVSLRQILGEGDEEYQSRMSLVLGYEWNGAKDERYHQTVARIRNRRENETSTQHHKRISIFRLSVATMVSRCHITFLPRYADGRASRSSRVEGTLNPRARGDGSQVSLFD